MNNKNKILNTFEGKNAVLDFLNPDKAPYTPLVEIPDSLNPYRNKGTRIFAKLMNMLPLMNVKSLPARNMLLEAKQKGVLNKVDTVIENSSGNTAFSLAIIARLMGIPHTKAIVSHKVSRGKLNILRFLGTEVIVNEEPICPDPSDPTSGIYKAKVWAKENSWFNPGQYDNKSNPEAHYKWTGPQIWEQTKGKIFLLASGLGTTGSVVGISRFLKEKNPKIQIVGVSRIQNNPVPGVRTNNLLRQIAFDWKSQIDFQEEVGTVEAFRKSMELCRSGLFVGPSSGFALVGLLRYLSKQDFKSKKEKIAVFICPDSPFPYIDEYFEYLNEREFSKIDNEHLLINKSKDFVSQNIFDQDIKEIEPMEAYRILFSESENRLWERIRNHKSCTLNNSCKIIDIREKGEFDDHHIPGAKHALFIDIDKILKKDKTLKKAKGVIFVCIHGNKSRLAALKAKQIGINAMSMKGGDAEWSRLNLPRIRSEKCILKYDL